METYRLKNIILVILLLLNVFLLLLVASRGYAQHRSAQNLIDQTVLFLQNSNVSIDPELLQGQDTAFTYSYERNMEEEQAFTAALLGTLVKQQDAGGGTQQYTFTGGSAVFRSNGAFQLTIAAPELQVEKPEAFVKKYCPAQYAFTWSSCCRTDCSVPPADSLFPPPAAPLATRRPSANVPLLFI